MKRILCLLLLFVSLPVFALADYPDFSSYSLKELNAILIDLRLHQWKTEEWQEVLVPPGVYEIGVEIPAGHWSIRPDKGLGPCYAIYASGIKDQGHDVDLSAGEYIMECVCDSSSVYYSGEYKESTDFEMEEGHFIRLDCAMVFTPFIGKPGFSFR